jgi:hypothetical protein
MIEIYLGSPSLQASRVSNLNWKPLEYISLQLLICWHVPLGDRRPGSTSAISPPLCPQTSRVVDLVPPVSPWWWTAPNYFVYTEFQCSSLNMSHHVMPLNLQGHALAIWSNLLFAPQLSWRWHVNPWWNCGLDCGTILGNYLLCNLVPCNASCLLISLSNGIWQWWP